MDSYFSRYIQLALSGDDTAFETLYNLTKDSAYFVALNITKNEQDAYIIIQDSYIRAFENLSSLEHTEIFDLWLNRIIANSTAYFIRQKNPEFFNYNEANITVDWNENENYENLIQETVDDKDTRRIIGELVDSLPADQRLTVLLHYYWEMNISTIAETLDISEAVVKYLLTMARETIKESIKKFTADGNLIRSVTLASIPYVLSEASKMQFLFKPAPAFGDIISIDSEPDEKYNNSPEIGFSEQIEDSLNSAPSFNDTDSIISESAEEDRSISESNIEESIPVATTPVIDPSVLKNINATQPEVQKEYTQEPQHEVQPTNNTEHSYNPISTTTSQTHQNSPYVSYPQGAVHTEPTKPQHEVQPANNTEHSYNPISTTTSNSPRVPASQGTVNTEPTKPQPRTTPSRSADVRDLGRSDDNARGSVDNTKAKPKGFLGTVTGKIAAAALAIVVVGGVAVATVLLLSKNNNTGASQGVVSTSSEQSESDTSYRTGVTQIIEDVDNFSYKSNGDGTIGITSYFGTQSDVFIPNEVNGKKVTKVSAGTFKDCTRIKSITIPANIKEIDMSVLGDTPFRDCIYMENIYVNSQNKHFSSDNGVLYNIDKTKLIIYPSGRNEDAFDMPASVKEIGDSAFYGCSLLKTINIPSSVTKIGSGAFNECVSLKEMTIPAGVKSVEKSLFKNCSELKSVSLSKGIDIIKESAFYGCLSLENIELPDGLKTIQYSAFAECAVLEYVTVPSSVTNIAMLSEEESKKLENKDKAVFYRSPFVVIKTSKGSYAEQYAKKSKISYEAM